MSAERLRAGPTGWVVLLFGSSALSAALIGAAVPAAILLGPMVVAILFGVSGTTIRVPRPLFVAAQGIVGCLIARSVTLDVTRELMADWPALAIGVVATVAASTLVGFLVARYGHLPGSTAAWGSAPGAASAMVALADEYGADPRLVATMQYVRVICVVLSAALMSRLVLGVNRVPHGAATAHDLFTFEPLGLALTLLVAVVGSWLGRRLRIPAGGLMVPLVLGSVLTASGLAHLDLPSPLLFAAYTAIGWYVGLQFERTTVLRSLRALPEMIAASLAVMALCGAIAWTLCRLEGYGALTAFLATSPGGIDSVAIIAVDGGADTAFVMAFQTIRVVLVILTGPPIARFIARAAERP